MSHTHSLVESLCLTNKSLANGQTSICILAWVKLSLDRGTIYLISTNFQDKFEPLRRYIIMIYICYYYPRRHMGLKSGPVLFLEFFLRIVIFLNKF